MSDAPAKAPGEIVKAETLSGLPGIGHGFFTRRGGTSNDIYTSLNCGLGSRDATLAVEDNRQIVADALGARHLLTAYQVHSAIAVVADRPWTRGDAPKADAIITRTPGLALGALTADCTPVLFADPEARIVAAAHAGWRGAVGGVLKATIDGMVKIGAARHRIRAVVGPCINQDSYEVGPEFKAEFLKAAPENERFFSCLQPQDRPRFDLPGFVLAQLEAAGLASVESQALCTYANEEQFFSYRRSQHRNEPDYGRQISAIVVT